MKRMLVFSIAVGFSFLGISQSCALQKVITIPHVNNLCFTESCAETIRVQEEVNSANRIFDFLYKYTFNVLDSELLLRLQTEGYVVTNTESALTIQNAEMYGQNDKINYNMTTQLFYGSSITKTIRTFYKYFEEFQPYLMFKKVTV